jgi:hypothetical protein
VNIPKLKPSWTVIVAVVALVIGLEAPAAAHQVAHKISGRELKPNSVTGKQVKESTLAAVPEAKRLPKLVWHKLTLLHSWENLGGANRPAAYAVDAQGIVHLRGAIHGGDAGFQAFVVPASVANKALEIRVPVIANLGTGGVLELNGGFGFINPMVDSTNTDVSNLTDLEGVTFAAS